MELFPTGLLPLSVQEIHEYLTAVLSLLMFHITFIHSFTREDTLGAVPLTLPTIH